MRAIIVVRNAIQICLAVLTWPLMGQVAKKDLTPADYGLWSRLYAGSLAENGRWASYLLSYESGRDTLFVKRTGGKTVYEFPNGREGNFFGDDKFGCLQRDKGLCIKNLKSGKEHLLEGVVKYEITANNFLIAEAPGESNSRRLTFYRENGDSFFDIQNVSAWSYNRESDAIIYHSGTIGNRVLFLLRLENPSDVIKISGTERDTVTDFSWQENGQAVAFLKEHDGNVSIGLVRLPTGKYHELRTKDIPIARTRHSTASTFSIPLRISPDGQRVFFGVQNTIPELDTGEVELWNTEDKLTYPTKNLLAGFDGINKVGFWEPANSRCEMVSDNDLPRFTLTHDGKHAMLWNPFIYEPQQKMVGDTDYHILDIATGDKKLLLERQVGVEDWTVFSPGGKYVMYFRGGCWWAYTIASGETVNLTADLQVRFDDEEYDWPDDASPYGCPGWSTDDEAALVYDRYDVWKISPAGNAVRLTRGRETNTVFRIVDRSAINSQSRGSGLFDLSKGLWLQANSEKGTGFYKWDTIKGCKQIAQSSNLLTSLKVAVDGKAVMYLEQNYNMPPRLMFQKSSGITNKLLFQSNPQHSRYKWGRPEMLSYQNSKGEKLHGILYYPAGYIAGKKYPVIVRIYEKQSLWFRDYVNPSMHVQAGYNKTNFITNGYFVFEPDIKYEMGNPGLSAVDCVTAGVKAMLNIPGIDRDKVGLMGHSFGGYETNLILGKTNLFAAAVSSAGASDLTSHFLNFNQNSQRPQNFQFESGQFRMTGSLFEDRATYAANSPINFVQDINAPLLSWTGKNDRQVSPIQSMELHMALRRLGKRSIMLVYPDEEHTLMQKENQEDLVARVFEWFGHYLKGEPEADWMKPDRS